MVHALKNSIIWYAAINRGLCTRLQLEQSEAFTCWAADMRRPGKILTTKDVSVVEEIFDVSIRVHDTRVRRALAESSAYVVIRDRPSQAVLSNGLGEFVASLRQSLGAIENKRFLCCMYERDELA
jgi:deoxyribodipyrimidine photolyase-like uncharacterized protein